MLGHVLLGVYLAQYLRRTTFPLRNKLELGQHNLISGGRLPMVTTAKGSMVWLMVWMIRLTWFTILASPNARSS